MFVTVLLVAGSLALEREENAFPRLTRGLVGPRRPAGREGGAGRGRVAGGDAADAGRPVAVRLRSTGSRFAPILRRDRGRRRGVRCLRRRDRGGRPRGPRELAAGVHGLAADRVPLAGPESGTVSAAAVRRDRGLPGAVPVRPRARRDAGRARRGRRRGSALPLLHLAILVAAYGALARLALRRFAA